MTIISVMSYWVQSIEDPRSLQDVIERNLIILMLSVVLGSEVEENYLRISPIRVTFTIKWKMKFHVWVSVFQLATCVTEWSHILIS